jgi:hypothetical protein
VPVCVSGRAEHRRELFGHASSLPRFTVLLGLIGAVVAAVGAAAALTPARSDIGVTILGAIDSRQLGRPNVLDVSVTNRGSIPLEPVYAVEWDHYPFVWDGPSETLAPGETRRVVLQTDNYEAMPPPALTASSDEQATVQSVPFVVRVNNAGEPRYWASAPWTAAVERPPLVNGDFHDWLPADFAGHGRTPVGWDNYSSGQAPDVTRVKPDPAGLRLAVAKAAGPDAAEWSEAAVARQVAVSACPSIELRLAEWPEYQTSDRSLPVLIAGAEVFADSAPGRTLLAVAGPRARRYGLDNGLTVWEQQPAGNVLTINLAEARTWIGAGATPVLNVKVMLSVHRSSPTRDVSMLVRSVRCAEG